MADPRKRPKLTTEQKNSIGQWFLQHMIGGELEPGAQKKAAEEFGICIRTVKSLWAATKAQLRAGKPVSFWRKTGKNHIDKYTIDKEKVMSLSVLERSSIRKMAAKMNVSKSLLATWIKQGQLRAHTSSIKPTLSDVNKLSRLRFSLSHLQSVCSNGKLKYKTMQNIVHIDEKWFFITKTSQRYYLLPGEPDPYRHCKSKRYITKIMFMSVVSRPIFGEDGQCIFDGKIGIFPFTTLEPATRNSKNRPKGTLVTKALQSITKEVSREFLINQIVPAIIAKWPDGVSKDIIIQQDNAKRHICATDPDFIKVANSNGFRIQLHCQPANSPDTNINDLGFFRAIQSLQDVKPARNVDDLLRNVTTSFEEMPTYKLNNVFLTLQGCFTEMMKTKGGNDYKIPHIGKAAMIRMGTLPECLEVEEGLVRECVDYLNLPENDVGIHYNIDPLVNALGY